MIFSTWKKCHPHEKTGRQFKEKGNLTYGPFRRCEEGGKKNEMVDIFNYKTKRFRIGDRRKNAIQNRPNKKHNCQKRGKKKGKL